MGNHILINVIIDKILNNALSLIIKHSALDIIEIIITVKNVANIAFITL